MADQTGSEAALASVAPATENMLARPWPRRLTRRTFKHRVLLIEAELARLAMVHRGEALELYEQALLATAQEERFHPGRGPGQRTGGPLPFGPSAVFHRPEAIFLQAIFLYGCWGAAAKTTQLEEEFSELLAGFRHFMSARGGTTLHRHQHPL